MVKKEFTKKNAKKFVNKFVTETNKMKPYRLLKLRESRKGGNSKDTVFQVTRKNKKMLNMKDLDVIYDDLIDAGVKHNEILIRARNIYSITTLKGFEQEYISDYVDDYFDGDPTLEAEKFQHFFYVEITVRR